ncbi:MAG: hypothetical protein IKU34_08940 [Clostridia bacterium]|nr:hypothetical protein [Clostridia bacterium]
MHKKKPFLEVMEFDERDTEITPEVPDEEPMYDPDRVVRSDLTDELEQLAHRRQRGRSRLDQMKSHADSVRRSMQEVEIIRPQSETEDSAQYAGDDAAIRRRQQLRQDEYVSGGAHSTPRSAQERDLGYFSDNPAEQPIAYDDDDPHAPYYYDGYEEEHEPRVSEDAVMPRRVPSGKKHRDNEVFASSTPAKRAGKVLLILLIILLSFGAVIVAGIYFARRFVITQDEQTRKDNEARVTVHASTTQDGHPTHILTIYGKENATVYLRETQTSYVISDGKVTISIPDYMWYDTESSTFATAVETDTMDVTITPYIRHSQEGEQYALEQVHYTIDVPASPVYLLNPSTPYAEVGVSIYEVRLNVQLGSTVIIDGTNVSTLIRDTGNVSKNVPVLPVGDNTISISVKSKYCRETKMEIKLHRPEQEIPLELVPTVIVEWNYEYISPETYNNATAEERKKMNIPSISGTTLPGATITVDFPHRDLVQNFETGEFSFVPKFTELGNNQIVIRASYEGRADSSITHTVYYMPNADIYTRRAWDLAGQYTDLINYINMRKGTIYMGTGTIQRIISTAPQMAVMNIGDENFEKLVMLENSSKTTWVEGTRYRIYGDVYGMYDTMPRLTVRYTYLTD